METRDPTRRSATLDEPDDMMREPLPREPISPGQGRPPKALILSGLSLMLTVALVVTTAAVLQGLRAHSTGTAPSTSVKATVPSAAATTTAASTATVIPYDPAKNGWTRFTPSIVGGDLVFAPSNPQRGYLCGQGQQGSAFAVTVNGGQTWQMAQSLAQFSQCSLQVSASSSLDVAMTSYPEAGPGGSLDAHYSTDGGKTWQTVPIPQNPQFGGDGFGAVWSGSYLYFWIGRRSYGTWDNFLEVSANGSAFATMDTSKLLPGAQDVSITNAIATGITLYLNLGYTGCSSQSCAAIVASGDGGKTWTQIPNQSTIELMAVTHNMLYGRVPDAQSPQDPTLGTEMTTSDNGTTWTQLKLPAIPDATAGATPPIALPAPDGTLFATFDRQGAAYVAELHGNTWTVWPLSSAIASAFVRLSFAADASGKPTTVWVVDEGNDSAAGIYSRPLP